MKFSPRPVRLVLLDGYGVTLDARDDSGPGERTDLELALECLGYPGLLDAEGRIESGLYDVLIGAHREGRSHVHVASTPAAYREMVRRERREALAERLGKGGIAAEADLARAVDRTYAVVWDYIEDFYATVQPLPGVADWLDQLRGLGFTLSVCSNSERVPEAIRRAGLSSFFARVLGAEELGTLKPMGESHRRACALSGYAPAEAAAVDDRWTSGGLAASRAGLRVVLLRPDPADLPERLPRNAVVADRHDAVTRALRAWAGPSRTPVTSDPRLGYRRPGAPAPGAPGALIVPGQRPRPGSRSPQRRH